MLRLLPFQIGKQLASDLSTSIKHILASIAGLAPFSLLREGAGILDPIATHTGSYLAGFFESAAGSSAKGARIFRNPGPIDSDDVSFAAN